MIRFILKSAIWLSLAFLILPRLIPADSEEASKTTAASIPVSVERDEIDKLISGGKAAIEVGKFCLENSSICETGQTALVNSGWQWLPDGKVILEYMTSYFTTTETSRPSDPEPKLQNIPVPTPRESVLPQPD